jgi:hypothetical protein
MRQEISAFGGFLLARPLFPETYSKIDSAPGKKYDSPRDKNIQGLCL